MKITSTRLTIRPVKLSDSNAIFEYRSDKKVNQYQGFIPETIQEMETFVSELPSDINMDDTWFQLVIILKSEQQIIGDVGLHFVQDRSDVVELGCTINAKYQKQGYATEALLKVKEYLIFKLKKKSLRASVDPRNIASIKMLENIGMKQISFSEKSYNLRGEWVDDAVYQVDLI